MNRGPKPDQNASVDLNPFPQWAFSEVTSMEDTCVFLSELEF